MIKNYLGIIFWCHIFSRCKCSVFPVYFPWKRPLDVNSFVYIISCNWYTKPSVQYVIFRKKSRCEATSNTHAQSSLKYLTAALDLKILRFGIKSRVWCWLVHHIWFNVETLLKRRININIIGWCAALCYISMTYIMQILPILRALCIVYPPSYRLGAITMHPFSNPWKHQKTFQDL